MRPGLLRALGLPLLVLGLLEASAAEDGGGGAGAFSHPPIRLSGGAPYLDSTAGPEALEDPVAYCLSCHGAESAEAETAEAEHPGAASGVDHPVDVRYPERDPDYRAPSDLAPALLLQDRRMTCLTCHAYDDPGHALVLTTERSELCRACHLT